MEFPEGSVDIVTGSYALRNAPDLPRALGEIRRILKPAGTAAFLDFSKPRSAIFRIPQYLLLRTWCGSWGLILHGNHEIHGYIAASLAAFPDRANLLDLFARSGFALVLAKRFFLGITELLVFRRTGSWDADQPARISATVNVGRMRARGKGSPGPT